MFSKSKPFGWTRRPGSIRAISRARHGWSSSAGLTACVVIGFVFSNEQASGQPVPKPNTPGWRAPNGGAKNPAPPSKPLPDSRREPVARVPNGAERTARHLVQTAGREVSLPNEHGQVWREYDITPYTLRATSAKRPEQDVLDWILRETGYEIWHGDVVAVLSADERRVTVYHTPQVQEVVANLLDRFINEATAPHSFGLRIVTVGSCNWRVRAQRMLQPVPLNSPGAQAWLLRREDVALLLRELRKRTDFRELSSPRVMISNGQTFNHIATRPRNFNQGVLLHQGVMNGFVPQLGQVEEGFTLEFSPLLSRDGLTVDGVLKCSVCQMEKLHSLLMNAPSTIAPRQRAKIEIPQIVHYEFSERFRWPTDQVLLVSQGVVPHPLPREQSALSLFRLQNTRADFLVFIESRGPVTNATDQRQSARPTRNYHGRY
ncbi:MAG: hypothetical protein N2C14_16780 [Planctomycetales bacterium]